MTAQYATDGAGPPAEDPGAVAVSVVRVVPDDWPAHRDLRLAMLAEAPDAFWASLEEVRARTEEQWREEIRGPRIHLQARRGQVTLGGIAVLPQGYTPEHHIAADEIILASLWVRPAARGTGASRSLFRAAARLALDLGRPRVLLEVDDANGPARRLYDRLGLVETGVRHPRPATGGAWVEYAISAHELLGC